LEHFGPEPNSEPLAGDLLENFCQGRSRIWYWRQVLTAIRWQIHLLQLLVLGAISAWYLTRVPGFWHSPTIRLLEIVVVTAILFAIHCTNFLLSGPWKAALLLFLMSIAFLLFTFQLTAAFAERYSFFATIGIGLLLNRKHQKPAFPMTYKELLVGDDHKERSRLISRMEQSAVEETIPELRQVYAQAITVLRQKDSSR